MKSTLRALLSAFVMTAAFAAAPARADSPVIWTLDVPTPTIQSTSSSLQTITSDSLGDAFVVITLSNTVDIGAPITTPVGSQLFLLNPKGKVIGSVEVSALITNIYYVSSKRVIVSDGSNIIQLNPDSKGNLVTATIPTQTQGETLVPADPLNENFKYLHTTLSTNSFISTVKRYLVTKLTP